VITPRRVTTWASTLLHDDPMGCQGIGPVWSPSSLDGDLTYEVSFKGVASQTLRAAFVDCELDAAMGVTVVRCTKQALRGVIAHIEEFGLELLDVRLVAGHPAEHLPRPHG
jgi:hypothetical protein